MKTKNLLFILTTIFSFYTMSIGAHGAQIYAPDGRTAVVSNSEVLSYVNVGWYTQPVATLYSIDGRSIIVFTKDVSDYCNVGWYTEPVVTLYAPDGRSILVLQSETSAYCNAGWYQQPVATIYAPDGRTAVVYKSELPAYISSGWYDSYYSALNVNRFYGTISPHISWKDMVDGQFDGEYMNTIYIFNENDQPYLVLATYRGGDDNLGTLTITNNNILSYNNPNGRSFKLKLIDYNTIELFDDSNCYSQLPGIYNRYIK